MSDSLLSPVDTEPIAHVEPGMLVVDSKGVTLGIVEDFSMSDPEAVTVEGNQIQSAPGWWDDVARVFGGQDFLEPRVAEPLRTRLERTGFLKLAGPGLLHHERYVRADRIARVRDGRVELSVPKERVNSED